MALMIRRPVHPMDLMDIEDFFPSRLFEGESFGTGLDIYETPEAVTVEMPVPGIRPEEISITVTNGVLTISGERKQEENKQGRDYHRQQIRYGRFSQSIALPADVEADKADASFTDGMLKVELPKAEKAKPKQIQVKVGAGSKG